MKVEKIYEIPVNDAFNENCECAMCFLEKKLEAKNIEFCLGPAMMKPEFRIETNKKGFCRRHLEKMARNRNCLPLALVLDTHVNSLNVLLDSKKGLKKAIDVDKIMNGLEEIEKSCTVCDLIKETFQKYINVTLFMWLEDDEFRRKFNDSKGFCIEHFNKLLVSAKTELSKKEFSAFSESLIELEKREMLRINEEIDWFTKKFDYKNKDAEWKNSKDAPYRTSEKLKKYMDFCENQ